MNYKLSKDFALTLDDKDELKGYRQKFHIPKMENGEDMIYFCGNSLGLQPKKTKDRKSRIGFEPAARPPLCLPRTRIQFWYFGIFLGCTWRHIEGKGQEILAFIFFQEPWGPMGPT